MTGARRTLALTAVGCTIAAGGGAAFAATQHHSAPGPVKTNRVTRPTVAQHHCPHMGMAPGTTASTSL